MAKQSISRLGCGLMSLALVGCAASSHITPPKRSVNEQLLLDQSLEQGLTNASIPIPPGKTVALEVVGLTEDKDFVQAAFTHWLAQQGYPMPGNKKEEYLLRVMVHAFGTNVNNKFVGVPPISGGLFPIALPELALYKYQVQNAFTRFSMDIYDSASGRLLSSTPNCEGYTYLKDSTVFFGVTSKSSNLNPPVP